MIISRVGKCSFPTHGAWEYFLLNDHPPIHKLQHSLTFYLGMLLVIYHFSATFQSFSLAKENYLQHPECTLANAGNTFVFKAFPIVFAFGSGGHNPASGFWSRIGSRDDHALERLQFHDRLWPLPTLVSCHSRWSFPIICACLSSQT